MSYATSNGIDFYYEEQGEGAPLVLLHGGIGSGEMFAALRPALKGRRVITVDLQGHGRTADVDRPFDVSKMADDVAGILPDRFDLLGYSLGGKVAVRLALQHPERVDNLIVISVAIKRSGNHPEVIAAMDGMSAEAAEFIKPSPPGQFYAANAPDPDNWGTLIGKTADAIKQDFDWTDEIRGLKPRTLLVFADADSIRPDHIAEFYGLLGGGLADAGWDGSKQPANQLAILPGRNHYNMLESPLLAPVIEGFLQSSSSPQ
ncbi:alpha/beta fold hydrolase [Solirubrobacter soli]|uniref:alpha/beta fold hydrolase n=1 Tax=Solirubrobacter soli TaxID=363832 RepID=UPI0004191008|nr:alpha/beta hydrolase [Solirubrobacter soli]